jgi:colanic acid/amylovoran biosynthesis glycosyltransferase
LIRRPVTVWGCVNVRRYGREARTLRLLSAALSIRLPRTYDVIHCQFGVLAPLVLRLCEVGAISGPLVVSIRGFDVTQYLRNRPGFYDDVFPHVSQFLPVSDSLRQRLLALGCQDDRISILRSGIDCKKFVWRIRNRALEQPLEVLSVARLVEKKGLVYGIEAAAQLVKKGYLIRYRIIGDGPLRETLQAQIDHLGIQAQVELLGARTHEQIVALLDQAHVFLAPSVTAGDGDQEGIPNVVKEAMAAGVPVLSTRHSGIPELVQDGVTGYLVPERDVQALARRLEFLYQHPEQWPNLATAARRVVETDYNQDALNARLEALYQSVEAASRRLSN